MFDSDVVNLILQESATAVAVPPEGMEIGRSASCLLQLDDPNISRRHARIVCGQRPVLVDLASKNGTYVNDELLQGSRELQDGDVIRLGSRVLTVRIVADHAGFDSSEEITSPLSEDPPTGEMETSGTMTGLGAVGRVTLGQTCPVCEKESPINATTCGTCGYRWSKARPMASTQRALPAVEGRRKEERRPLDLEAVYSSSTLLGAEGVLENLSSEGAFIRMSELDGVGSYCTIEVRDEKGVRLSLNGFVRHVLHRTHKGKMGMGIEFGKLSPPSQAWLSRVLRQLDGLD